MKLPRPGLHGWRGALLYHAAVAGVAALLLSALLPRQPFPLAVPFAAGGDGVLLAAAAKGVAEEGSLHLSRIGAPFGTDILDWPLAPLPLALAVLVVRVTGEPGLALNLMWLLSTVLAAVTAAWALRRLGHASDLAAVAALAFAFLPYGFYRNVGDTSLVLPLAPLLVLAALRAAGVRTPPDATDSWLTATACLALGLSSTADAFLASALLLAGAGLGWARTRSRAGLRAAAFGLLLLAIGTAVAIAPRALDTGGRAGNERLQQRFVAESDALGSSLRQMLLPIDEHPFPPLRRVAARMRRAFDRDADDAAARLGTLASLGFVALLALAFARAVSRVDSRPFALTGTAGPAHDVPARPGPDPLGAAAALALAVLLVTQVGGLGSLVHVLLAPGVRASSRGVVFVAFLALHALAAIAGPALGRLATRRAGALLRPLLLALAVAAVVADQVPRRFLADLRWSSAAAYGEAASFVATVEASLAPGAQVFQLPHAAVPLAPGSAPPLALHDAGRPYLHSRTLRWSWGATLGRHGDWQRRLGGLSPAELARQLALAGFDGLWIDRWRHPEDGPLPWRNLESTLADVTGAAPTVSIGGRYSFLSLATLRARLAAELGHEALGRAAAAAVPRDGVRLRWVEGCSGERGDLREPSRVCGARGRAEVENDGRRRLRVRLSARVRALRPGTLRLHGEGWSEELALAGQTTEYARELALPAGRSHVAFTFSGPCEATAPRARCIEFVDVEVLDVEEAR